ncbi:AEC family transporter [Arabiibacter massiliensis]|uniref:AEC family transporter n=1 Tax=Arabiibacter massiliensis TaxID=1870985 RepID=UPI0009BC3562|nr:AEC family transporter [Arabiibacter massiliensis]
MLAQFADIFVQMVVLFAVGATGYVAKRAHLMDEDFDKKFSKLMLSTALPALMLASVLDADTLPTAAQLGWTIVVSCASYVVLVVGGFALTAALRVPDGRKGVFRFMMMFGNTGFIGFPVTEAVFGTEALIYATVFNLVFNVLVFSLGVWLLATDNKYGVKVRMGPKSLLSPCIVASMAAIVLAFLGLHSVPVVGEALGTLGSLTTPAAMLIIGSSLANVPVRQLVGGPRLVAASLVRLLVAPALVWAALHLVVSDHMLLGVVVVLSAMPVAANGTMICHQYGGDAKTMAQGTFVTTLGALVTIPLMAALFA